MLTNCPLGNKETHACWECLYSVTKHNFNGDVTGYDCGHPNYNNSPKEDCKNGLRVEIKTDCFINKELAKEEGWYRKFFYCRNCDFLIRTETWDKKKNHMFGCGTVLKTNETPKYCPDCGTKLDGGKPNE